jgi:hypothetical protein
VLQNILKQKREVRKAHALAAQKREHLLTEEQKIIDSLRQKAPVEEGKIQPFREKRTRRVVRYKDETAKLAEKIGRDPDEYLEECRNRGTVITYYVLKLKLEVEREK